MPAWYYFSFNCKDGTLHAAEIAIWQSRIQIFFGMGKVQLPPADIFHFCGCIRQATGLIPGHVLYAEVQNKLKGLEHQLDEERKARKDLEALSTRTAEHQSQHIPCQTCPTSGAKHSDQC